VASPLENLSGPGRALQKEAPDAKEFAGDYWLKNADWKPELLPQSARRDYQWKSRFLRKVHKSGCRTREPTTMPRSRPTRSFMKASRFRRGADLPCWPRFPDGACQWRVRLETKSIESGQVPAKTGARCCDIYPSEAMVVCIHVASQNVRARVVREYDSIAVDTSA
jgi:hypothetical protein